MAVRVRICFCALALIALVGCATSAAPNQIIVLLAPFEGRYREVGYQALYAVRLALADANRTDLTLLALDDGGTAQNIQDRVMAINQDSAVQAVLLLGQLAEQTNVSGQFRPELQVISLGDWQSPTATRCGDLCTLQTVIVREALTDNLIIETLAPPVEAAFRERYRGSGLFVPEPLPIAQYTYAITSRVLHGETPPVQADTPRYRYRLQGGELIPLAPN